MFLIDDEKLTKIRTRSFSSLLLFLLFRFVRSMNLNFSTCDILVALFELFVTILDFLLSLNLNCIGLKMTNIDFLL